MGADLVVFPELSLTGYPPRDLLGLHGFVEANIESLGRHRGANGRDGGDRRVRGSQPARRRKGFLQQRCASRRGTVQAVMHKTLLPTYDVFDEDRYFEGNA